MQVKQFSLVLLLLIQSLILVSQSDTILRKKVITHDYGDGTSKSKSITFYNVDGKKISEEHFQDDKLYLKVKYSRKYDSLGRLVYLNSESHSTMDSISFEITSYFYSNTLDSVLEYDNLMSSKDTFLTKKILFQYGENGDSVIRKTILYKRKLPLEVYSIRIVKEYKVNNLLNKRVVDEYSQINYSNSTTNFWKNGDSLRIKRYYDPSDSTNALRAKVTTKSFEIDGEKYVEESSQRDNFTEKILHRYKWNSQRDTLFHSYRKNNNNWKTSRISIFNNLGKIVKKIDFVSSGDGPHVFNVYEYEYNKNGLITFEGEYYIVGDNYDILQPEYRDYTEYQYY